MQGDGRLYHPSRISGVSSRSYGGPPLNYAEGGRYLSGWLGRTSERRSGRRQLVLAFFRT